MRLFHVRAVVFGSIATIVWWFTFAQYQTQWGRWEESPSSQPTITPIEDTYQQQQPPVQPVIEPPREPEPEPVVPPAPEVVVQPIPEPEPIKQEPIRIEPVAQQPQQPIQPIQQITEKPIQPTNEKPQKDSAIRDTLSQWGWGGWSSVKGTKQQTSKEREREQYEQLQQKKENDESLSRQERKQLRSYEIQEQKSKVLSENSQLSATGTIGSIPWFDKQILIEDSNIPLIIGRIKSPKSVKITPQNTSINVWLAILYLFVLLLATQIFNAYRWTVSADRKINKSIKWFKRKILGWIGINQWWWSHDQRHRLMKHRFLHTVNVLIALIIMWLILSFVDPDHNLSQASSRIFTVVILCTVILWGVMKDIVLYIVSKRHIRESMRMEVMPSSFGIWIVSAIINKWFGLLPPIALGSVVAVRSDNVATDQIESGRHLVLTMTLVFIITFGLRWVSYLLQWDIYVLVIWLVYGLFNDIFWSLIRSGTFWGKAIYEHSKRFRFGAQFLVLFAFIQLIFHPEGDLAMVQEWFDTDFAKMIYVLVWAVILTWGFRLYAKFLHPKLYKQTSS